MKKVNTKIETSQVFRNAKNSKNNKNRKINMIFIIFILLCGACVGETTRSYALETKPTFEIAFSPNQGATDLVISSIRKAKKSAFVAVYCFTSKAIAKELIIAAERGVQVKVILDGKQSRDKNSMFKFLQEKHINVRRNYRYAIMHHKFMIIDNHILQLGSFNYTNSAEKRNAENVLVIDDDNLAHVYLKEWQKLWDSSQ